MGILGGAIGAGLGAVGSIFGGIAASKAMKQYKKALEAQRQANRNWYDRRYNEDSTQRADAQAMITRSEQAWRERNRQAAGRQAVTGGSEESVAVEKDAANKAIADTTAAIAADGAGRQDAIDAQFQAKDEAIQSQLNDLEAQKAGNVAQAAAGVAQAGANIAGLF